MKSQAIQTLVTSQGKWYFYELTIPFRIVTHNLINLCDSFLVSRTFEIPASEYNQFLQLEIQLNKYKGLCEKKAKEIKNLQDQVARYKRRELKRSDDVHEHDDTVLAPEPKVTKKIFV